MDRWSVVLVNPDSSASSASSTLDRLNVGLCMTQSTNTQLLSVLRGALRDPRAAQLLAPLPGSGREVGKSERTCGLTVKTILIVKAEAAHASKVE